MYFFNPKHINFFPELKKPFENHVSFSINYSYSTFPQKEDRYSENVQDHVCDT